MEHTYSSQDRVSCYTDLLHTGKSRLFDGIYWHIETSVGESRVIAENRHQVGVKYLKKHIILAAGKLPPEY